MSNEFLVLLVAMVVGSTMLCIGFALGVVFGARASRPALAPKLSSEEEEQLTRETQRSLAEKFTPGISREFMGPSFGRPCLITFHTSDYEDKMMCAVGEKDTHELASGEQVYEIPVNNHDGQEGLVMLVCYQHGRPENALA